MQHLTTQRHTKGNKMPLRQPQLEEMTATDPANQELTEHVVPTMPQQQEHSFAHNAAGA